MPGRIDIAEVAGRFGHLLHAAGIASGPASSGRFAEALATVRPVRREELYWCARVTMVSDVAHLPTFDRVFHHVFGGAAAVADPPGETDVPPVPGNPGRQRPVPEPAQSTGQTLRTARGAAGDDGDGDEHSDPPVTVAAASAEEQLRAKPFGACTPEELERLRTMMRELDPPLRRSRRHRRADAGRAVDLRASLQRARRTAGEPLRLVKRHRTTRTRRVVLIADVSGSMEAYGRAYLYLLHGAVRALRAEAFVFATRLHRLTRQLRVTEPSIALAAAVAAAPDWSGGTRLGEAVKAFNDGWARRGIGRGAVVVIVSDGWDGGDPALLGREMERLSRLTHRVVWVNPRSQSARYRPLAGGMAAALPHVDVFVSGHNLDALDSVLEAIRTS
jgi:uncharacterized protein with von Willebrand factor type A (vWA) domain